MMKFLNEINIDYYDNADQLTLTSQGQTNTNYYHDYNGALVQTNDGTNVKNFSYDELGRMTKVKDGLNNTLGEYTFNPDNSRRSKTEGGTTTNFFYDFEDIIGEYNSGSINSQFTYTGREYSSATDNYYYRARYYNANMGRFLSRDPFPYDLTNPASIQRYNYVQNSPIYFVDPLGLLTWDFTGENGPCADPIEAFGGGCLSDGKEGKCDHSDAEIVRVVQISSHEVWVWWKCRRCGAKWIEIVRGDERSNEDWLIDHGWNKTKEKLYP